MNMMATLAGEVPVVRRMRIGGTFAIGLICERIVAAVTGEALFCFDRVGWRGFLVASAAVRAETDVFLQKRPTGRRGLLRVHERR